MSYADQMAAVGANADAAIARKAQTKPTTTHHDAGAATGAAADAALAAAQPPTATLYGVSCGDSAAATVALVHPHRMRCYNQGQLGQVKAARVSEQHHSEKPDLVALANRDTATMNTLRSQFGAVSAGRVTIGHETDNNTPFSKANGSANQNAAKVYQAAWTVFLQIIGALNVGRDAAHKLITVDVTTGVLYRQGVPEWWIVRGAAEHGVDIYDPNNFDLVYGKLTSLGYTSWCLPETGYQAGHVLTDTGKRPTDAQMLARQKADVAKFASYPHPPKAAFIFNNNDSQFQDRPATAAYIASLCAQG